MTPASISVQPVTSRQEAEVLDFLSAHPLFTFVMTGWIKDNGLESPLNRGSFYAATDARGELNGVALIGHVTMFETNSQAVLSAFADISRECPDTFVILGEERRTARFMDYRSPDGENARASRQLLFTERSRRSSESGSQTLRRATLAELDEVTRIHAQMSFEQTGINPLADDAEEFRARCARRIHQGRVWVCVEDGRLRFKADVVTDLPEVNYLEGIYVPAEDRGRGFGSACLRQLTNVLLSHTKSVCMMAEENQLIAQACYAKAGFKLREHFTTVFLDSESNGVAN
jgi:ribosomal protein S18 acetylase RimI-like enzyme